jgi:coproporphyrinogen III oxidase
MTSTEEQFTEHFHSLHDTICSALEADGVAEFFSDKRKRIGGRGGDTRVMIGGRIFGKGGINTSVVYGELLPQAAQQLKIPGTSFFACILSLMIHPHRPFGYIKN